MSTLRRRSADVALLALAAVLTAFSAIVVAVPAVAPAIISQELDVAIQTAAVMVTLSVAGLNWARGRVSHDTSAVLRGSAFAILAVLNGLILAVVLLDAEEAVGGTLDNPGQLPLWAGVIARTLAAGFLVAAGVAGIRARRFAGRAWVVLLGPALLVAVVIVVAGFFQDALPELADAQALRELVAVPPEPLTPGSAPALVLAQAAIGTAFLAAAGLAHRSYRGRGRIGDALLAGGLLIAAVSQLNRAIHPGTYAELVTMADLLGLAFYGVLLVGIVFDSRDDLRELRQANVEISRLAEAQMANAALEERARIAREIHDGLAQDLWFAKLKQSRLAQLLPDAGEPARRLSDEVSSAIDDALAEAQRAVVAMRPDTLPGDLPEMIERQVEDFADRFALRAEVSTRGPLPELEPRTQAEVLRIVQEALTNVRKHADATVIRAAIDTDGVLLVTIADNGRGFRPEVATGGFGLESMRQRAALIGAALEIESAPQDGTRVRLTVPLADRREEGSGGR